MKKIVTLSLLFCVFYAGFAAQKKWNVVYMMSDDHAYQAIGAYGGILKDYAPTPTLNKLAEQGMRFDRCYVGNSICGPARAMVLTGKHSHKNGFYDNRSKFDGSQLTFPKVLQKNGYETAIIGKWHLVSDPTGFDYWEILPGQGAYYNPDFIKNGERIKYNGYVSDITGDRSIEWLKNIRNKSKPFMLMVHFKAPHRNWEPALRHIKMFDNVKFPEPDNLYDDYAGRTTAAQKQKMSILNDMTTGNDLKMTKTAGGDEAGRKVWDEAYGPKREYFKNANLQGKELLAWKYQRYLQDYLATIAAVDENIARIMKCLKDENLAENTVIFYTSDQGFYMGEHGWFDKRFMHEESFRTPLIVYWPGVTKGVPSSKLVQNIDFAETILDIAGAEIPSEMQGVSFAPILKGENPSNWRKSLYYHYYEFPGTHNVLRHDGVIMENEKLINYFVNGEKEYYNIEKDPKEMHNGYNLPENKDRIAALEVELQRLRKLYDAPDYKDIPGVDKAAAWLKQNNLPLADEFKDVELPAPEPKKNAPAKKGKNVKK